MKHIKQKHEHAKCYYERTSMHIKSRSLEIVTNSKAPTMVVVPPKPLIVMHPRVSPSSPIASTIKAPNLSRLERSLTYIKNMGWGFWYPFFLGSLGVSLVRNPKIFISKIKMI